MKIKVYITLLLATLLMQACGDIAEEDRLIYVKPAAVERSVLLEDFTGQRCVNCPNAADEIAKLHEQYGDAIIAVSIHSGPLGFRTNSRFLGLATDEGDEYYNHWNLEFQPVGLINRGAPAEFTAWGTLIRDALQRSAPVDIDLEVTENDEGFNAHTKVKGVDGDTQGKLQLWIVEDDITAFQMMPDGTRNDNYVHQHVFRATVNGTWGEDISVKEGYTEERDFTLNFHDDWKPEKLSVIAFIYNNTGVLQVTKTTVIARDD